jgi:hypothetical protein
MGHRPGRLLGVATAAAVVAAIAAGSAFACDGDNGSRTVLAAQHALRQTAYRDGRLALPSAYLAVPRSRLAAQLAAGKTLAEIADATPGKSSGGLVDYVVARTKARLDRWVASGKATQAQANGWVARLRVAVTALVGQASPR